MAYKAKFLHFKTKQSYNTERNKTVEGTDERKVFDAYISFIDEGPTICTWGKEYKCELSKEDVESLIDSKGFITIEDIPDNIDASKITSGTLSAARLPEIPIEKLPAGALERLVIVENQTARYQLTSSDVQEGDTVKQNDTGVMYFVVDINNLSNENGYKVYTAGAATSVPWSGVTSKPNTLEGYGIESMDVGQMAESYWGYQPQDPGTIPYPREFTWTNGTTAGPTGNLVSANMNDVEFPAIPAASETTSGIITTDTQSISGTKTFKDNIYTENRLYTTGGLYSSRSNKLIVNGFSDGSVAIGSNGMFSNNGQTYSGNAATATKVNNKLTFTGAVTGEYDGSSALTINIPEGGSGGSEIPIALPNPYPIKFTGAVTASYDGSNSVTVNIPSASSSSSMTYTSYDNVSNSFLSAYAGNVYTPKYTSGMRSYITVMVIPSQFTANKANMIIVVYDTTTIGLSVAGSSGKLLKAENLPTDGEAGKYRIYAFTYLGGSGTSTIVAVNCATYNL